VSDPVSWLVIEPGWEVVDASGELVGKVEEVVGDREDDIFSGLKVATSLLGKAELVPAEKVGEITEGRVQLVPNGD
jgi:sporulation protein YlmC with PRC-barrel domain